MLVAVLQRASTPSGLRPHPVSAPPCPGVGAVWLGLHAPRCELARPGRPAAQLVKLRYFAGLSPQGAAEALGVGRRAADRLWVLARAWLRQQIAGG